MKKIFLNKWALAGGLSLMTFVLLFFWARWGYHCLVGSPLCGEGVLRAGVLHLPVVGLLNFMPTMRLGVEIFVIFILGNLQYFLIGSLFGNFFKFLYSKIVK